MQIQSGKLYENKTWKYLFPCLKYYGTELTVQLNSFLKIAVGVADINMPEIPAFCLFILIDTSVSHKNSAEQELYKKNFDKFLNWLQYQKYFIQDYVFENKQGSNKHMIVLKIPEKFDTAYINFTKGKYGSMYSFHEIRSLLFKFVSLPNKDMEAKVNERMTNIRGILTRNPEYLPEFIETVNKDFGTQITRFKIDDYELDYPPKLQQEIFNFKEEDGTRN